MQDKLGCISWMEHVQGLRHVKDIGLRNQYMGIFVSAGHIEVVYTASEKNGTHSQTKILWGKMHEIQLGFLMHIKVW